MKPGLIIVFLLVLAPGFCGTSRASDEPPQDCGLEGLSDDPPTPSTRRPLYGPKRGPTYHHHREDGPPTPEALDRFVKAIRQSRAPYAPDDVRNLELNRKTEDLVRLLLHDLERCPDNVRNDALGALSRLIKAEPQSSATKQAVKLFLELGGFRVLFSKPSFELTELALYAIEKNISCDPEHQDDPAYYLASQIGHVRFSSDLERRLG